MRATQSNVIGCVRDTKLAYTKEFDQCSSRSLDLEVFISVHYSIPTPVAVNNYQEEREQQLVAP